jgi:hypothetical protein
MNSAGIAKTLTKQGQSMTITRSEPVNYDPVTGGSVSSDYTDEWTVYGITGNYSYKDMGSTANGAGSMIQAGDKKAIIQAFTDEYGDEVEPLPGDVLTVMGVDWTVVSVTSLNPAGVNLMHSLQLRR